MLIKFESYLRLMRVHKPAGFLLLWFPTAWALWIGFMGFPPLSILLLLMFGSFIMRAAGCVINDIADRHIDLHVKRTALRPLTTGEIGVLEALILLGILLVSALLVLVQLPPICFYYALFAIFITFLYPFCKRFMQMPQIILGIAFSMGIPMAFAVADQAINSTLTYLMLINCLWIISYDTQYAMIDREDDLRIGVKSTAIYFGKHDRLMIGLMQLTFHLLWLPLAYRLNYSIYFLIYWLIAALILFFQQYLIANRRSEHCLQAFATNCYYGLMMWLAIVLQ